jgi:hypothetical protein
MKQLYAGTSIYPHGDQMEIRWNPNGDQMGPDRTNMDSIYSAIHSIDIKIL